MERIRRRQEGLENQLYLLTRLSLLVREQSEKRGLKNCTLQYYPAVFIHMD